MLQLQSAFGVFALLAIAWAFGENRRAVSLRQAAIGLVVTFLTAVALIKLPFVAHALRCHQRRRRRDFGGLARRHLLRVRLSRRRRAAVRPQGARRRLHPGVSGAAGRAHHERADHAAVLLARAAAGGARHGVALGAHARRRRRGRTVDRRQYLSRHGGSALVHPALPRAADPQRIVPGDDRRHGRHRRHRAGALRHLAGAIDSRCRGTFCHCLGARRAGGDSGQPDHGAGDIGQTHRRCAWRSRHARFQHHGRDRQGHHGRARTAAQHRRDADRAGGAGLSRQRDRSGCCPMSAVLRFRCSGCSATPWRRCAG